jgi:hypothetical protein
MKMAQCTSSHATTLLQEVTSPATSIKYHE